MPVLKSGYITILTETIASPNALHALTFCDRSINLIGHNYTGNWHPAEGNSTAVNKYTGLIKTCYLSKYVNK